MTPQCLWFTGLSGAGKSTIANIVNEKLKALGVVSLVLDADALRRAVCKDLGFSAADRSENVRRIAEIARRFVEAGAVVLVACIAPFEADRRRAREIIGTFTEVFVDAPLSVCEQRDVKGLYARARRGELHEFTGIDSPYEHPLTPELRLHTDREDAEASAERVLAYLRAREVSPFAVVIGRPDFSRVGLPGYKS